MNKRHLAVPAALAFAGFTIAADAQQVLGGEAGLACEAVLCLSTVSPPEECAKALRHYFSISHRKPSQTIRLRQRFLALCPASPQTAPMSALVPARSQAAGRCDAASLNASERKATGLAPDDFAVGSRMPAYCEAYLAHAYSDWASVLPRYVGVPERGGYWVSARDHARAQREWQAKVDARNPVGSSVAAH